MYPSGKGQSLTEIPLVLMKRTALLFFSIISALTLLAGCKTYDYDFYGTISGTIEDNVDNSPISGAQILVMPGSLSATTSEDGKFRFENLEEGQYTISVQKNGYQANRQTVNAVSGEDVQAIIHLIRIPNE